MNDKIVKRKVRADAAKNRQRLLEVAKNAFARDGISASLEEIARQAGVGIGTLYRHFPKRENLISEIYRDQGEELVRAAADLKQRLSPAEALHEWLLLFIKSLDNKQIMAGILGSTGEEESDYCLFSGETLVETLDGLLNAAFRQGTLNQSLTSLDILCAVTGIASYAPDDLWGSGARRLVSTILKGMSTGINYSE